MNKIFKSIVMVALMLVSVSAMASYGDLTVSAITTRDGKLASQTATGCTVHVSKSTTEGSNTTVSYTSNSSATPYLFAKATSGYVFKGWSTSADGSSILSNSNVSPYNGYTFKYSGSKSSSSTKTTIYAVFEQIPDLTTYITNGSNYIGQDGSHTLTCGTTNTSQWEIYKGSDNTFQVLYDGYYLVGNYSSSTYSFSANTSATPTNITCVYFFDADNGELATSLSADKEYYIVAQRKNSSTYYKFIMYLDGTTIKGKTLTASSNNDGGISIANNTSMTSNAKVTITNNKDQYKFRLGEKNKVIINTGGEDEETDVSGGLTINDANNITKFQVDNDIEGVDITYTRDFTEVAQENGGWQSWFVPFDYTAPTEGTVSFAKLAGAFADLKGQLYIAYIKIKGGSTVKANTPYLVTSTSSSTETFSVNGGTIKKTTPIDVVIESSDYKFTFQGLYKSTTQTGQAETVKWYAVNAWSEFVDLPATQSINAFRFIMKRETREEGSIYDDAGYNHSQSAQSDAKVQLAVFGDESELETAIKDVKGRWIDAEGFYDLTGRKVQPGKVKGFFINGGKKYFSR